MKISYDTLEFPLFKDTLGQKFISTYAFEKLKGFFPAAALSDTLSFQDDLKALFALYDSYRLPELLNDNTFFCFHQKLTSEKAAYFSPDGLEYLVLKDFLFYLDSIKKYISAKKEQLARLKPFTDKIQPDMELAAYINQVFDVEGNLQDGASSTLRHLRHAMQESKRRIQAMLRESFARPNADKYIQEQVVVLRNGRYTIPCKTNFAQYMQGIIHDRSTSGSTVYVEPSFCVSVNNELQDIILAEREEVARILAELAERFTAGMPAMNETVASYAELIFRMELATFFHKYETCFPEFGERLNLHALHHPLLIMNKGAASVPVDISLSANERLMVISGPNTGGKTAAMKSLGLNHILGMCGLPLFARHVELIFFSDIQADIGDKQSLVMDLSTFSSHMMSIKDILQTVGKRALVLFDELGTGTDPKEGAALALAVLEYLRKKGATVALTTHFSEVKSYAFERSDAKLYAVDFDYDSFAPRYNLLEGVAGSSDPLMIAGRLGFPEDIISDAEKLVAEMKSSKEALLDELHLMKAEAEHSRKLLMLKEEELTEREARLGQEEQSLQERLEKRELELLEDSMAMFQKGKRLAAEKAKASAEEIDGDMASLSGRIQKLKARQKKIEGLKVGDMIYLERFSKTAKILSMDKKTACLDMGNLKMQLPLTELVGRKVLPEKKQEAKINKIATVASSRNELLLVGKRVEEAIDILDKYLDDALLTGYDKVYIIHGRGSGQLRRAVQEFLRMSSRVKGYETASAAEGGNAVTVANL